MHPTASDHGRDKALDGVRGLAILMVILLHASVIKPQSADERWFMAFTDLGRFGVDLFFVLSGFLITRILLKAKGSPGYFRNFYVRRVLRIFPLYYALILFSFLVLPAIAGFVPRAPEKLSRFMDVSDSWPWYLAYGTNFLIALRDKYTHGILDVSWSLCIEEHFYLVWPLVVARLDNRRLRTLLGVLLVASPVVRWLMWNRHCSPLQIYVLTFSRLDGLAFGCLLSLMLEDLRTIRGQRRKLGWLFATVTAAIGVLFLLGQTSIETRIMSIAGYTLASALFAILVAIVLVSPGASKLKAFFQARWLTTLGKYSYALYLFNLPIRAVIRDLFWNDERFRALSHIVYLGQAIFYVATLAISLLVAWLSWNLLENRFLSLKEALSSSVAPNKGFSAEASNPMK